MKAKKKFPDLNKDGKITKADILKGRGVFDEGGTVEFRSKDRETAKKMLRDHFQKKGGKAYMKNAQQPSMSKDTKTGEFIARPQSFAKGGKVKSRVNEAGNYTKPGMRKRIFNQIKAGSKGGRPGQWSARKAQLLASRYKKAGGGYKN